MDVNAVDLIVIVFVLALAVTGFARGLVRSALPLAGFVAGAAIGGRLGPALLSGGSESAYAPLVTVFCGLLLGVILAVALDGAGLALHQAWDAGPLAARLDGVGGAALLGALGLVLVWALGAVALHSPGPGARDLRAAVQDSRILRTLNEVAPPSGPLLNVLRRVDPSPAVRGPQAKVGPPDPAIASAPGVEAAGDSVTKVLGTSCGLGVEGSGWVAAPGIVVTNAHVVAGEDDTTVTPRSGGSALAATAVHYDPGNDLALLRVPGLEAPPLAIVGDPAKGTPGAVLGYPENGPFAVAAARIGGTGQVLSEDSYGRGPIQRAMTPFRGEVRSGNSGGPVVDRSGGVLTTVFASAQGSGPESGLGVPNEIVERALAGPLAHTDTGPCTA
jgi:S1-C subfamily serine protease